MEHGTTHPPFSVLLPHPQSQQSPSAPPPGREGTQAGQEGIPRLDGSKVERWLILAGPCVNRGRWSDVTASYHAGPIYSVLVVFAVGKVRSGTPYSEHGWTASILYGDFLFTLPPSPSIIPPPPSGLSVFFHSIPFYGIADLTTSFLLLLLLFACGFHATTHTLVSNHSSVKYTEYLGTRARSTTHVFARQAAACLLRPLPLLMLVVPPTSTELTATQDTGTHTLPLTHSRIHTPYTHTNIHTPTPLPPCHSRPHDDLPREP